MAIICLIIFDEYGLWTTN